MNKPERIKIEDVMGDLITLEEVPDIVPEEIPCNVDTASRWAFEGLDGIKLKTHKIPGRGRRGGKHYTTKEWVHDFLYKTFGGGSDA